VNLPVNLPNIYLKPGELYFSKTPALVTTVLGSCISLTMVSHKLKVGAIIHALLPVCSDRNSGMPKKDPFNYVDCSVTYILSEFEKLGIKPGNIEAKLFGGSNMFSETNKRQDTIGSQNIKMAVSIVEKKGINLVKIDVGGIQSRKIIFHTSSGDVWLRRLNKESQNSVIKLKGTDL
jgi:chemotaxis protein CheD